MESFLARKRSAINPEAADGLSCRTSDREQPRKQLQDSFPSHPLQSQEQEPAGLRLPDSETPPFLWNTDRPRSKEEDGDENDKEKDASSPMSHDGFHEMVAADWPATGEEIAMQGRTEKSKPDPFRRKIETVPSRSSFFRKKCTSIGWPWHGLLIWSSPWKRRLHKCLDCFFDWGGYADKICAKVENKKSSSERAIRGKVYRFWSEYGEFQDLNFNLTTATDQDVAKLFRNGTLEVRVNRKREDLVRSEESSQESESSAADALDNWFFEGWYFLMHTDLLVRSKQLLHFSFKIFNWVWLNEEAGSTFRCMR